MTQDLAPVVPTELPELPVPDSLLGMFNDGVYRLFTADQMRAYARAALAAHPQQGWQPIETAPKWKPVLLWWRTAPTPVTGRFVSDEHGEGWMCDGDRILPRNQADCTHWMPLPEPPGIGERSKG